MDFLDSLDLNSVNRKCNRVRSWYLYEQYRSLEKNQLDAALRLKNKSYQDKILKQELKERRARRRLCSQFGLCQSETRLGQNLYNVPSEILVSDEDIFESFCELHNECELGNYEDDNSQDSRTSKEFDDFTSAENTREDYNESVNSVILNVKVDKTKNNMKEDLETIKKNIAENINLQLDTVKENIECLKKYTILHDNQEIPQDVLIDNIESDIKEKGHIVKADRENSVLKMWSKFVGFAYKIMLSNHGNCYHDYSSQMLTAVLVCDVLLRGFNRMCYILQPYVSPIKYAPSDSETSLIVSKKSRRKHSMSCEKIYNSTIYKNHHFDNSKKYCKKFRKLEKKYKSENDWYNSCKNSVGKCLNEIKYGTSEPLRSTLKFPSDKSCGRRLQAPVRAEFSDEKVCKCHLLKSVVDPMLQLTHYIERLLQDIEELN